MRPARPSIETSLPHNFGGFRHIWSLIAGRCQKVTADQQVSRSLIDQTASGTLERFSGRAAAQYPDCLQPRLAGAFSIPGAVANYQNILAASVGAQRSKSSFKNVGMRLRS